MNRMWIIGAAVLASGCTVGAAEPSDGSVSDATALRDSGADSRVPPRMSEVILGPGATASDPALFDAVDDASLAPELLYPPDGIMVPPNLNELELHYRGAGTDVYELHFSGSVVDVKVYFTCEPLSDGCVYTPDSTVWQLLSDSERGRTAVTYRLRGASRAGTGVGASVDQTITFAQEDITGGLYYWNAGAGAVRRYDFGLRGQRAENFIDAARAGAMTCVGCHTLSRDGSRVAVGLDIPSPSPYKVYDVATRTQIYQQGSAFGGGGANFFSFSPDASQIMTSNGISIDLRDATDGSAIVAPLVDNGAMPDWSADGLWMVYAQPGTLAPCFPPFCGSPGVDSASLETMRYDGSTWSAGSTLVEGGGNNYYPTISPDGEWVLFNRSPSAQSSMDASDAELFVVRAEGGPAIRLDRSTSAHGDSWPKWDVTVYEHQGRRLMWFTVTSRRSYGLRLDAGQQAQLWMGAFDPNNPSDPGAPMFWLPFQEIDSGNHIAQWVTTIDRQTCTDDAMCAGGEFCQEGYCIPDFI